MGWQDDPISGTMPGPQSPAWMNAPETTNPYQQAAQQKFASLPPNLSQAYGPTESFVNGTMLGALPTVMAGLETPFSMIEHKTFSPSEGYNYAKAEENLAKSQGDAAHPYINGAADLAGGIATGTALPAARITSVGKLGSILGSTVDGAGLGAATGFLSGEGDGRISGAEQGGLTGGAIGGGIPLAGAAIKAVASPVTSNIAARLWPENSAKATLARALVNSGKSPEDIQAALDNATAAGQPQFTAADALGKPGADMLSNVVRSPGEGGTQAANFLDARQTGQGRDVAGQLQQGLGVNSTADQLTKALTTQRGATADVNYGAARAAPGAAAVNVSPAIQAADSVLTPGVTRLVNPNSNISDNSVESAVRRARGYLTDGKSQLSNFNDVLSAKQEIDNMIESGTPTVQRALMPMKQALDSAMIDASPAYKNARDTFAGQSRAIDAIDTGSAAAKSGRPEDTIPAYNAMAPDAQSAYRTGYADPLLENATNGNPAANKALPLSNEGTQAELANMSQYQGPQQPGAKDQLAQALQRSSDMNSTFRRARTGSQTFDNLAEGSQEGMDPGVLWEAARGNFHGVAMDVARKVANSFSGSTPEVRNQLSQLLLMRGPNADFAGALSPNVKSIQARQALARALMSGVRGATANLTSGQNSAAQAISSRP